MGFVGSLFGMRSGNSGGAGLNYNADKANIMKGFTQGQIDTGYDATQQGLGAQQAFMNALAGQGGLQNQSNVFNQQQALANQLQNVANGTGPNPAMAQLNQTTGQNVANQAALMAGQRGVGSNAGLLARQAAQQGSNIQQQAVGQGASLAAQQQLAGMNALQNQQNMMGQLAAQQVGQQGSATMGYNQLAQNQYGNMLKALAEYNNANVGMQSNQNNANASVSQAAAGGQKSTFGGLMSMFNGSSLMGGYKGGVVQGYADGGPVMPEADAPPPPVSPVAADAAPLQMQMQPSLNIAPIAPPPAALSMDQAGPSSAFGKMLAGDTASSSPISEVNKVMPEQKQVGPYGGDAGDEAIAKGIGGFGMQGAKNVMKMAPMLMALNKGAVIPGKADVKGDSVKNDKVPAMLSPKEIVLPRSITLSPDAPEKAKQFVAAIMAKQGLKRKLK